MTRRRTTGLWLIAAFAAGVLVACGGTIPVDEKATELNRDQLNPVLVESTTTTAAVPDNAELRRIYLIGDSSDGTRMFSCPQSVEAQPTLDDDAYATLDKLIRTEPGAGASTCPSRLTNYVPTDLRVNATTVEGGTVTVDLTGLAAVESSAQRQAVAQIVFTLTDLEGIERVIFFDGRPISVPMGSGSSEVGQPVSRTDFPEYNGTPATSTTVPGPAQPAPDPAGEPLQAEAAPDGSEAAT